MVCWVVAPFWKILGPPLASIKESKVASKESMKTKQLRRKQSRIKKLKEENDNNIQRAKYIIYTNVTLKNIKKKGKDLKFIK